MAQRINRAIELLAQDQAIYYTGGHSGHVLTRAQGREDAQIWADYINVGMEHGAFDMTGLGEYMTGLVRGRPDPAPAIARPRSLSRRWSMAPTPLMCASMPGSSVRFSAAGAWVLLCQAESADAVHAFVESCRYPHHSTGVDPAVPSPVERMRGGVRTGRDGGLGIGTRGRGSEATAAPIWGISTEEYIQRCEPWPLDPAGELLLGVKLKSRRASPIASRSSRSRVSALPSWGRAILAFRWAMSQSRASLIPPRCAKHASGCLPPAATIGSRFSRPARPRTLLRSLTRACGSLPDIARKPPRSVAPTSAAQCPSELPPGAAAPLFAAPTLSGRRRTAETCVSGPVTILLDLGRAFVQGKTILVPADFR